MYGRICRNRIAGIMPKAEFPGLTNQNRRSHTGAKPAVIDRRYSRLLLRTDVLEKKQLLNRGLLTGRGRYFTHEVEADFFQMIRAGMCRIPFRTQVLEERQP